MKKINFKTLLLAIGLVVASVQTAWARGIFLNENWMWDKDGATIYIATWDGKEETIKMTKMNGTVWYADINDEAKQFNFKRMDSNGDNQWGYTDNQTVTGMGTNNVYTLSDYKDGKSNGTWSKYAPNGAILGDWNNWDPSTDQMSSDKVEIELPANTTYEFKYLGGFTYYGWGNTEGSQYTFTGTSSKDCYDRNNNLKIATTVAGTYIFKWNDPSSNNLKVYFPSTVTFDANGHGTAPAAQVVTYNQKATKPADPSETGYTFGGWYKEIDCTNAWNFNTDVVTSDKTLYAKWTVNKHNLTWDLDGGTITTAGTTAGQVAYGTTLTAPTVEKTGYTFAGWSPAVAATMPDNDVTYTATWTVHTHSLSWETDGDELTGNYTHGDAIDYGTTIVAPNTPTKTGYTFAGWSPAVAATMPDNDVTYTATWTEKSFAVTVSANQSVDASATVSPSGSQTIKWFNGTEVTATPSSATYVFDHWEKSSNDIILSGSGATVTVTAHGTGTLTAHFRLAASYKLTVATSPSAAFTASSGSADNITLGQPYDISATLAEKGYTFTGWTAEPAANATFDNKDALSTTVTVNNGSVTVTANAEAYTTTLKLWNNDGTQNYREQLATYGQTIYVSPIERTGYKYGGYVTQSNGGGSKFILIEGGFSANVDNWIENNNWSRNANGETKELYAKWTAKTYNLTLNKNFTDGTASDGSLSVTFDSHDATYTACTSRAGYRLLGYANQKTEGYVLVVDAEGNLIANVEGYTDANGKWVRDGNPTLYAQWQEVLTTVALSTNPAGVANILISGATQTSTQVGVATKLAISVGTTIDNNAFTFTDWTLTNCSIVSNKLVGDGVNATGSAVANFALTSCKMRWSKTSSTFYDADGEPEMSYDIEKKAYYYDMTPTASPIYFRFKIGEAEWSADWDGSSPNIKTAIVNGNKLDCNQDVHEWKDRATVKYAGCSSYPIRVWFDVKNKKTWITADAEQQWSIAGSDEFGEWSTSQKVMTHKESGSVLWNLTVALEAKTGYTLKVVNRATGEYYGGSTNALDKDHTETSALETTPSAADINLTTTVAGDYKFQWSTGTKKLTVTYPTSYAVNFGYGTGGATTTAKIDNTTDITTGELVISGSSVTFAQTAAIGYTFKEWNTKQDGKGKTLGTDASYTTTINATTNVYAIYTENMHTNIDVVSSDENKGTVNVATVSFGITTGATITATPKAGYYVASWTLPEHAEIASGEGTGTITVKASGDEEVSGTITANFAERFGLLGKLSDDSSEAGLPGWDNANALSFTETSTPGIFIASVTLTYSNSQYKYMVLDRQAGINDAARRGAKDATNMQPEGISNKWTLKDNGYSVQFRSSGLGIYTFTLSIATENDKTYPEVYITNPEAYEMTIGKKVNNGQDVCGVSAKDEGDFDISTGKYIAKDGKLVVTAAPAIGYSFVGWFSDANCTIALNDDEDGETLTYTKTISSATSVYALFTENLTTVTLVIKGPGHIDGNLTSIQAGVYTTPSVTAVCDNANYYFAGWTLSDNADFEVSGMGESNTTITITGKGAGLTSGQTLTANFLELDKIYFNNINATGTWQWTSNKAFVYFDPYWDKSSDNKGAGARNKTYKEMSKIDGTDIWWAYVPRGVNNIIAFSDQDMHEPYNFGDEGWKNNHAVYRTDYNRKNNMYVPKASTSYHNTDYFSNGYWMRYDTKVEEGVGYYLHKKSDGTTIGEFTATATGSHVSQLKVRIDGTGEQQYYITSASGLGYGISNSFTSTTTTQDLYEYEKDYLFEVTPTSEGDYYFVLTQGEAVQMSLTIVYPVGEGDYRVMWVDNSNNERYSDVVKSNEAAEAHTLSMYLNPSDGSLKLQKCTGITDGVPQWSVGNNIGWTSFTKGQGVYQFDVTITADNAALTNVGLYTGNYYIKTDGVKGGWGNYKENIMDENTSTFSKTDATTYDRYYCQWISNEGKQYNVKCVIANDYCNALSDTLRGDTYVAEDGSHEPYLPKPANVRFSYNTYTNTLKRDYISGSSEDADRFLMLINTNDKMYNIPEEGDPEKITELKFTDKNNWVYQADIKAQPGCAIKLTAEYDGQVQYFIGKESGEGATKTIINSSTEGSTTQYTMRAVYDFKTNLLVAGWIPSNDPITDNISLGGDMLISRTHQDDAQQITFGVKEESGTPGSISDIHHVYAVLTIKKDVMLGTATGFENKAATNSDYSRTMYWISFPFDVKISEVFGVDGYGKKWIMQRYNGEKRAQIGWFAETETFWEYLAPTSTLQAYKGYLLILNANYFNTDDADVWKNSATEANFYFPSAEKNVGVINQSSVEIEVPAHECGIDRTFGDKNEKNHMNTDSHWNVIGVPAFQNSTASAIKETYNNFKSYYAWDWEHNTYNAQVALGTNITFNTMQAYMVQYAGTITWENVSVVAKKAPYAYVDDKNYMIELFFNGNGAEDHTYINLSDEANTDFVLNEDMMKITNAGVPNIYTYAGAYDVAYNETKMDNQTVMVGVSAPKDGTYTFSMPKQFSGTAKLVDLVEGITTDLNVSNYSVDLEKGTYNSRFQLLLEVEAKAPTSIEADGQKGREADGKTLKLLRNNNIYLINSGRVYNATGTELR